METVDESPEILVSLVVPIRNEQDVLQDMADQVSRHLDEIVGPGRWQFVLVDNGSTDKTPEICKNIVARWPGSLVLHLKRPDIGDALFHGLVRSSGTWAFVINADFWDAAFMRWCYRTRGAYDLVMASKRADAALNRQQSYRKLLSWGLNVVLQTVFGFVGSDTHGPKFIYLPALRPIFHQCVMRRGQFDTEFTLRAMRAQLWLAEVPVPIVETRPPRNLMLTKIVRNFVDITRLYGVMKSVPATATRYHRWSREDVENESDEQIALVIELGKTHRNLRRLRAAPLPAKVAQG